MSTRSIAATSPRAAFAHTAAYDTAVATWTAAQFETNDEQIWPPFAGNSFELTDTLRYGENPHQAGALYTNAAYFHRRALCIGTVTDHIFRSERLDAKDRQSSLDQMIRLALDTAVKMAE